MFSASNTDRTDATLPLPFRFALEGRREGVVRLMTEGDAEELCGFLPLPPPEHVYVVLGDVHRIIGFLSMQRIQ